MWRYFIGRLNSFRFAFKGLRDMLVHQPNAQIHLAFTAGVVAQAIYFKVERWEWALLLLSCGAVFAAEALNTALEYLADALHPGHHPLIGRAKDATAAGVLLLAIAAAIVGVVVFWPYWRLLFLLRM